MFYKHFIKAGADCKVSNTRMFQGQSSGCGTLRVTSFNGQLKWFKSSLLCLFKKRGGQLLTKSSSLISDITWPKI